MYFIHGDNTYLVEKTYRNIVKSLNKKHGSSLRISLHNDNPKVNEVIEDVHTMPLMSDVKLVVVIGIVSDTVGDELNKMITALQMKPIGTTILFVEYQKITNTSFMNAIESNFKIVEHRKFNRFGINEWIKVEAEKYGMKITIPIANILATMCNNNLYKIESELAKLNLYKINMGNTQITIEEVNAVVVDSSHQNIFKAIEYIMSKNYLMSLKFVEEMIQEGNSLLSMTALLHIRTSQMIKLKYLQTERKPPKDIQLLLKIKSNFAFESMLKLAPKTDINSLKKLHLALYEVELGTKTGTIAKDMLIHKLIASV